MPVVLDIEVENGVRYVADVTDLSKLAVKRATSIARPDREGGDGWSAARLSISLAVPATPR